MSVSRAGGRSARCQAGETGGGIDVLPDDGNRVVSNKWWPAGHHLVKHGAQGIKVGFGGFQGRDLAE
jgi:murein endopeptidase